MVPVIRVNFGMAVRSGAPKPDVSSAEALKRSLLAATSILITDPATGGISGVHFMSVLERLGIADEMKGKLKPNRGGGYHAERIAKGEADLAIQAEHEIRCVPGVEFVPYPAEFQRTMVFMAGRGATPQDAAGLRRRGDVSANADPVPARARNGAGHQGALPQPVDVPRLTLPAVMTATIRPWNRGGSRDSRKILHGDRF